MIGKRVVAEPPFYTFWLEDYVPADHSLRAIDALLDKTFIRRIMAPTTARSGDPRSTPS